MSAVTSADGTRIAYDRAGSGDPLVLIGGAFSYRRYPGQVKLAELLAAHFTVYSYDRRGRGDSGDTAPYAVDREIEDLGAVIEAAGGQAHVWGLSSGAMLALRSAVAGSADPPDGGAGTAPGGLARRPAAPGRPGPAGGRAGRRGPPGRRGPLLHGGRDGRPLLRAPPAAPDARGVAAADRGGAHPALRHSARRRLPGRAAAAAASGPRSRSRCWSCAGPGRKPRPGSAMPRRLWPAHCPTGS